VYLPDIDHPAYPELLEVLEREFAYSFGGCTLVSGLEGSYLSRIGSVMRDRVNLLYTDTPFTFAANFATLSGIGESNRCPTSISSGPTRSSSIWRNMA
jgi:hypothetical protein